MCIKILINSWYPHEQRSANSVPITISIITNSFTVLGYSFQNWYNSFQKANILCGASIIKMPINNVYFQKSNPPNVLQHHKMSTLLRRL